MQGCGRFYGSLDETGHQTEHKHTRKRRLEGRGRDFMSFLFFIASRDISQVDAYVYISVLGWTSDIVEGPESPTRGMCSRRRYLDLQDVEVIE